MTLRLKIILSLLIGVAVLFASFTVYKVVSFFSERGKAEQQKQENVVPTDQDSFFKQLNTTTAPPSAEAEKPIAAAPITDGSEKTRGDLISLALPFAERFGSYSNQANYANLEDLLPFMTETMQTWAKEKIAAAESGEIPTLYKGVTTRALSQLVISLDEKNGSAQVKVSTQRKELIGTSTNFKVYNQDLLITFAKDDTAWLVDSAVWQ